MLEFDLGMTDLKRGCKKLEDCYLCELSFNQSKEGSNKNQSKQASTCYANAI